ncbi:MAG: SH3 domain-containing protein [Lachnospiraceae bacterium]|nr:SH3 domain-containing protein [Lachnospiraceae bacterium]
MAKVKVRDLVEKHLRYFIVGGVFLVLIIILIVFLIVRKGKDGGDNDAESGSSTGVVTDVKVPKDKYEVNAYPNVNALMEQYYTAMVRGEIDTVASLCDVLSDEERFRMEEKAKYYYNADDFYVYTKKGYRENSYLVFVTFNLYYIGAEQTAAPSLDSTYVCTNESGSLYVNKSDLTEEEQAYILEIVAQDDVQELIDEVNVAYNKAIEDDPNLETILANVDAEVSQTVKDRLSEQQRIAQESAAAEEAAAQAAAQAEGAVQVRATSAGVNIRSSPSQDSTSLGKTTDGQTFTRYEAMENGWSKIDYNGSEAYIKSDYLQEVQSAPETTADGQSVEKVTVKSGSSNIRVRSSADSSGDGNIVGSANGGDSFELIERQGDWVKIRYNGQEAYISAQFVD